MKSKSLFYEPMTVFTDLILFFLAVYFALDFHTLYLDQQMNTHWHWTFAFWMIGIGALLGAISHGIGHHFSPMVKKIIWKMTVLSIGISCYFVLSASFSHVFPNSTVRWLKWIPLILLVIYCATIIKDDRFSIVILFYLPTMIFVLLMMMYSQFVLGFSGSGWISLGMLIGFLAAGVQMSGYDLHKHFNHNDLYHVIQMAGIYCIHKGTVLIRDFGTN